MKTPRIKQKIRASRENLMSEFLILPDGRILVHNLTRPFAELLHKMNPTDEQISSRIRHHALRPTHP
jgi:hypothetical protein